MRVLSGIQPTGSIHIGNYLGAIKQWVELQEKNECVFFIADSHSLTIPYEPKNLQKNTFEAAVAYLAAGIDPEKSIFYIHSHLKDHFELAWILSCLSPLGDLSRMTQYKEKAKQFKKNINAGLLNYPILQAADILLFKAESVPVGKDQLQHVELARTLARKFNQRFGKVFPEPKAIISKKAEKILSLNNPKKKMSKSLGPQSYISLFEEPETIRKKIMSAVTDNEKTIKYNPRKKPGISNLLVIYSLFSGQLINILEKKFQKSSYAQFKKSLAELLIENLEIFRKKRKEFLSREVYVQTILNQGAKRARVIAESTMSEIKRKIGLSL